MVGGAISLKVTCKTDEAQQNVFNMIDKICDEYKIKRDDAINIILVTNKLYDTIFKIEVINKYSLMPKLINLIQNRLYGIEGVSIERIFDSTVWNINKKKFINVEGKPQLSKELYEKLALYQVGKNSAHENLPEKNNSSTYN